ncbi:MAG: hypothetical protein K5880_02295 [Hydrogenophaga sp.]|uniref:hypothetical protein n=1 Tax=Hydrogenophaga sp. TaxID=1904254 RepID=UPI002617F7FF|nr:hypothetical protein [Hydrogenophaga sp.]MCV0437434.1 hypothetical protein [Hydrogenophaga sp.]
MKSNTEIASLATAKARNLVRGMISNPDPAHVLRALEKIRSKCSEAEFRQALLVLRESEIFRQSAIGRDFNREFPRLVNGAVASTIKPTDVLSKIGAKASRLAELVSISGDILRLISAHDYSGAIKQCRKLFKNGGASVAALRYLHFIRNRVVSNQDLMQHVDEILLDASIENVKYIATVIRELSSSKTDYFNITNRIRKADLSVSVTIARTFIDPIPRSPVEFEAALNSYYYVSLFDAFLYMARLQQLQLSFSPGLNGSLFDRFLALNEIQLDVTQLFKDDQLAAGLDLFRESFLLPELNALFLYRTVHGALFNTVERKEDARTTYERRLLANYFAAVNTIADIGSETVSPDFRTDRYVRTEACHFQNSTALIYLLERQDGDINHNEVDFVRLMSRTRDIGIICPQQHLENIKFNAQTAELKIVACALSHIKQRSQLKEHELRAVLQAAAANQFSGKYTALLNHVYAISPAVAEHLVQFSDETFLSKLFQIMGSPNAAIEERASILEWYGNKTGDTGYLDRAKNLRIDVQINKERGTIDDSRIYVDPLKFTQWVSNQVLDQFAILLESLPKPIEPQLVPLAWDKVKTGVTTYEQLGSLIVQCYEEFCSNKVHGISSYLGRRIRHGTLKNTSYNDVVKFQNDERFAKLFEVHEFASAYRDWLRNYEQVLDDLRDKYLYIHTKTKPDGLIFLDFPSSGKRLAATHLLHDILKSFAVNNSAVELPYIILEYCWRIVEEDLAAIRKFVMEKKAQYGVFRAPIAASQKIRHRDLQDFSQELNSVAVERFRTIELWFNKPSIASPSADIALLFKAVVSEIKGQFPDFHPALAVDDQGFMLNGGVYHVIYDALFILIYNAAQKGKADGTLKMDLDLNEADGKKLINIRVESELMPGEEISKVAHSINAALQEDCEDALVIEGRSGIKKLRRMEQAGYIRNVSYTFSPRTVIASFSFALDY